MDLLKSISGRNDIGYIIKDSGKEIGDFGKEWEDREGKRVDE